jgi:hypothetical protein
MSSNEARHKKIEIMTLTGTEIYKLSSETTVKQFENLKNLFTAEENNTFNTLVRLGDDNNVALWTVISERYQVKATQLQD